MSLSLALALLLASGAERAQAGIRWERNFEEAIKKAKAQRKPVMIDFWAEWCGWCHRLDQTTYVDPDVVRLAESFVTVKVDTEGGPKEMAVVLRYDVSSLPTIAFVSPSGRQILRLNGFQGPGQFPQTLATAKDMAGRVMAWEAALDKSPSDAAALAGLGVHLFEQEFYDESRRLLSQAVQVDGGLPVTDRKRIRVLLGLMRHYDRNYPEAEALLKDALALRPAGEYDAKVLYVLGKTYLSWGRRQDARAALQRVLDDHPGSPMAEKAREMLIALDRQ